MDEYNKNLTPPKIKAALDKDIIGQESVKKTLSMISYYYMQNLDKGEAAQVKSNALIIGDTGVGKTAVIKKLAEILKLPYAVGDASSLTTAGYKGDNISSIFKPFLKHCSTHKGNRNKIQGIVFIDELDKMIGKNSNSVTTGNLQNEFLKIIEGGEVHLDTSKYVGEGEVTIDTSELMFIFAGSFPKLRDIIKDRLENSPEGNKIDEKQLIKEVKHEDLENFGISREFLGRISTVKAMDPMDRDMLKTIFVKPSNSIINQYRKKLKGMGIVLNFTDEAIDYIVDKALNNNTGARGLTGITHEIMDEVMYKIPEEKNARQINVTLEAAKNKEPEIICSGAKSLNANSQPGASTDFVSTGHSSEFDVKTEMIRALVVAESLLVSAAKAEEVLDKVLKCVERKEEIDDSIFKFLFTSNKKLRKYDNEKDDMIKELKRLDFQCNFAEETLTEITENLRSYEHHLPTIYAEKETHRLGSYESIDLPRYPVYLERALNYKNKVDEMIADENEKTVNKIMAEAKAASLIKDPKDIDISNLPTNRKKAAGTIEKNNDYTLNY